MANYIGAVLGMLVCAVAVAEEASRPKPIQDRAPNLATTGPKPRPVETPSPEAIDQAIDRGIDFLLKRQNPDGSWGSARRTKGLNITAPIPGAHHAYRSAVTSLCISALIETRRLETGEESREVAASLDLAEAWMFAHLPEVRRATPDVFYNTWSHAYAIQALVRMLDRGPNDPERLAHLRGLIERQVEMLERYECVDGGWAYYDFDHRTQRPAGSTISFVTATVLVALAEAREIGIEIPQAMIDRATASIRRQRLPNYAYCYGEYLKNAPVHGINRPGGSLGRSQACNLAMRQWGDTTVGDDVLNCWLDRLFARNMWLDIGRKRPIPHESWFQVAGYFFYYGHYYAALCIEELPETGRGPHQDQMAQILLRLQEKTGCWWDYPLYDYHEQYGTAYALMSLVRCRRASED